MLSIDGLVMWVHIEGCRLSALVAVFVGKQQEQDFEGTTDVTGDLSVRRTVGLVQDCWDKGPFSESSGTCHTMHLFSASSLSNSLI